MARSTGSTERRCRPDPHALAGEPRLPVSRFWNSDVLTDIDVVLDTIYAALYSSPHRRCAGTPTPRPPPHKGEGSRCATHARPPPRTLLRRNPRPHAAPRGGGPEKARHRRAGRRAASSTRAPRPSRRRAGWRCTSPACRPAARTCARSGKGPRVGAPEQRGRRASSRAPGSPRSTRRRSQTDPKKGEFYVAVIERPGRPTPEVLAEILPAHRPRLPLAEIDALGRGLARSPASLRWVRPLQSIVCTFGPETEETEVVPFAVDGIRVRRRHPRPPLHGARSRSGCAASTITCAALSAPRSCSTPTGARRSSAHDAQDLAFAQGLELVEDEGAAGGGRRAGRMARGADGLVRRGASSAIPPEVIRATIRANQKCFVLRRPGDARALANRFILVANLVASDGGAAIVAGNERVVRARLVRRQVLLGDRPQDPAGGPAARS